MKGAELVLEYTRVLSWPVAVVALTLLFQAPIRDFLSRLKAASAMGVRFEAEARQVEAETRRIAEDPEIAGPTPTDEFWEQLVRQGARLSILQEWRMFEMAVRDFASDVGMAVDPQAKTAGLLRELDNEGHVRRSVLNASERISAQVDHVASAESVTLSADATASLMVAISRLTRALVSDESYSG